MRDSPFLPDLYRKPTRESNNSVLWCHLICSNFQRVTTQRKNDAN